MLTAVRSPHQVRDMLDFLQAKLDCCLVIDGESLQLCLDSFRTEFVMLATQLPAVVACRCSPTQKADVARLIREFSKKTVCCIGDGGNDVSMIQAADVGESVAPTTLMTRCRYRRQGRQAGLARRRLLHQPVLIPHATAALARAQLLQALGQALAVCHPPRPYHCRHPGRLQLDLLLCP